MSKDALLQKSSQQQVKKRDDDLQQVAKDPNHDATQTSSTSSSSSDSSSKKNGSVLGGTVRGALYTLQRMGISSSIAHAFVKKKTYLLLGQRPTQLASAYPSPVEKAWKKSDQCHVHWKSTYVGQVTEMVKGSILGIAVFGIYDYLIIQRTSNRLTEEESRNTRTQQTTQQLHLSIPRESKPGSKDGSANNLIQLESMVSWHLDHQPPLLMHFQAGALAGLMQSFLLDAWEIGEYLVLHRKSSFHYLFENLRVLNAELIVRRALHHSIGFATLFGSYEMIRLSMAQSTTNYLLHQGSNTTDNTLVLLQYFRYWGLSKRAQQHKQQQQQPGMASDDKKENKTNLSTTTEVYDVTALPIAITFCAGGLAGQAHYLVSHYLRQWRIGSLALNKKPKKKKQQQQQHHLHGKVKWKAIPWGPFLGSFLSTGVSFVAFQYAGELMEQWMTSESERTARTQMFI